MSRKSSRAPSPSVDPAVRRTAGNLAWMLREKLHEQIIFEYHMLILEGKNPIIVRDMRCTETGCYKVIEDPNDKMSPTHERRDHAMKVLLERRNGLPAQTVQLEAEIRSVHLTGSINAAQLSSLAPDKLFGLVNAIKGVMTDGSGSSAVLTDGGEGSEGGKGGEGDDVEDAEFQEAS